MIIVGYFCPGEVIVLNHNSPSGASATNLIVTVESDGQTSKLLEIFSPITQHNPNNVLIVVFRGKFVSSKSQP